MERGNDDYGSPSLNSQIMTPDLTNGATASDTDWTSDTEDVLNSDQEPQDAACCNSIDGCDCVLRTILALLRSPPTPASPEWYTGAQPVHQFSSRGRNAHLNPAYVQFRANSINRDPDLIAQLRLTELLLFPPPFPFVGTAGPVPDYYFNLASIRLLHAQIEHRNRAISMLGDAYAETLARAAHLRGTIRWAAYEMRDEVRHHFGDMGWDENRAQWLEELRQDLADEKRLMVRIQRKLDYHQWRQLYPRCLFYVHGQMRIFDFEEEEYEDCGIPRLPQMTKETRTMQRWVESEGARLYEEKIWTDLDLKLA